MAARRKFIPTMKQIEGEEVLLSYDPTTNIWQLRDPTDGVIIAKAANLDEMATALYYYFFE